MSRNEIFNPVPNEQEIVRWGDKQALVLLVTEVNAPQTIQLVKVHRHIPESWKLILYAQIARPIPDSGATFDVTIGFDLRIGSGSTQINLAPTIRMVIAGGVPTPTVQDYNSIVTSKNTAFLLFDIPACDIQIICNSQFNNSGQTANVEVAALAAPRYSPPTPGPSGGPEPEHPHEWMVSPFFPEPVRYK